MSSSKIVGPTGCMGNQLGSGSDRARASWTVRYALAGRFATRVAGRFAALAGRFATRLAGTADHHREIEAPPAWRPRYSDAIASWAQRRRLADSPIPPTPVPRRATASVRRLVYSTDANAASGNGVGSLIAYSTDAISASGNNVDALIAYSTDAMATLGNGAGSLTAAGACSCSCSCSACTTGAPTVANLATPSITAATLR